MTDMFFSLAWLILLWAWFSPGGLGRWLAKVAAAMDEERHN